MVSERDRIEKIVDYLNSQGVFVNISKNKARGHKGFFKFGNNSLYRIDIAKGLTGFEILKTLVHEFAHFIHFKNSNDLNFLDFIFPEFDEKIENELLEITVNAIPKDFASSIYEQKNILEKEKFELLNIIKSKNPKFKISDVRFYPEPLSYLLKYDRVVYNGKILSIENLEKTYKNLSNEDVAFFKLKSCQRKLKKITSKISKLNKYYNNKSELLARFCELYYLDEDLVKKIAPNTYRIFDRNIKEFNIEEFKKLKELLK